MIRFRDMLVKYRRIILYVFFGVLTTIINIATYHICFNLLGIPNVASTVIAWVFAVAIAFITNKLWVFDSKSFERLTLVREISTFLGARVFTGLLDVLIMYISVDIMHWNSTAWKLISNVIVVVLNYIASKLVIFRKSNSEGDRV